MSNENYTEVKIIALQKVMLHYGKKSLFWSLIIFGYLSFTMVRGQKIGFYSCEFIKFLNIANLHVWGKHILSCNDTTFILHFFSFFCFCNATFFYSGYVIKPLQPSSAIYGAPPFTGNLSFPLLTQSKSCRDPKFWRDWSNPNSTKFVAVWIQSNSSLVQWSSLLYCSLSMGFSKKSHWQLS